MDGKCTCNKCGGEAILRSTEGEFFPRRGTDKPRVFQVIDCPNCGRREQPVPPPIQKTKIVQ
jgi:hypothetical protein